MHRLSLPRNWKPHLLLTWPWGCQGATQVVLLQDPLIPLSGSTEALFFPGSKSPFSSFFLPPRTHLKTRASGPSYFRGLLRIMLYRYGTPHPASLHQWTWPEMLQFRLKMSVHMDFGTFYKQFLALIETEWLNYMKWWPLASSWPSSAYEYQISASLCCIIVGGLVFEIGAVSFCLEFYSEVFKLIYELGHISTISKMALNVLLLSCTKYLYKVTFSALMIIK